MWMNGQSEDAKDCEDCMLKDVENFVQVVRLLIHVSAFRLVREFRTLHFDLLDLPLNFLRLLFGFAFWIGACLYSHDLCRWFDPSVEDVVDRVSSECKAY